MHKKYFYSIFTLLLLFSLNADAQFWKKKKKDKEEFNEAGFVSNRFHEKFFEGMREYGMENYDKAIEAFDKCVEIDPNVAAIYFQLSKTYWEKGVKSTAISNASTAFKLESGNEDIYQNFLRFLLDTRNFSGAIDATKTFISTLQQGQSKRIKYQKDLARYYEYNRDYDNAVLVFSELEEDYGYLNTYALERLRLYRRMGKLDEALVEIDGLIEKNDGATTYLYQKARLLHDKGNNDEALRYYAKVLEEKSNHSKALLESGEILLFEGRAEGYERMKKAFAEADLDINDKINAYNRVANRIMSKTDKLDLIVELAKTNEESAAANRAAADALFDVSRKKEGVSYLLKAKELDPDNFNMSLDLVNAYYELKDFENLRKYAVEGADLYPSHNIFYLYAGIAFMELGDFNNALIMLETGKSFAIGQGGIKTDFKLSLAELFYKMGEYTESDKVFEEVLALEPNNATALNNYAYFLSKRKARLTDAETMVKKAVELEGGNASFLDTYGWVLFNKGEFDKAIENFNLALNIEPESGDIIEHKADAYFKKGDTVKALELWKLAQSKGTESKLLLKKINDKKYYEE